MLRIFCRHWFVIVICILVPVGFLLGRGMSADQLAELESNAGPTMSRGLAAVILFLMSFTLDNRRIVEAIRAPSTVLWASFVNAGIIPLLALPLMLIQPVLDFKIGLMIAASVPCTMAAASMWTRTAGGNDAISLLVTTVTNVLCFVVAPFWLGMASGEQLDLTAGSMVLPLVVASFVPIVLGQVCRMVPALARIAERNHARFTTMAQMAIAIQILWVCIVAGPKISQGVESGDQEGWIAAGIAWGSCIVLHVIGLVLGDLGGKWLGASKQDRIASAFAASQKTLPIGVLIAGDPHLIGRLNLPFAVFPMLMYHVTQLVIDTVIAERLKPVGTKDVAAEEPATDEVA